MFWWVSAGRTVFISLVTGVFLLSNLISSTDDKMHPESLLAVREGACAAMGEYEAEMLSTFW